MSLDNLVRTHQLARYTPRPAEVQRLLDALRKKRNVNDYSGDLMEPDAVAECIVRAEALLEHTEKWLAQRRPDLMLEGDS